MSDIYHAKTGKLIAKLKERIAELEAQLDTANKSVRHHIELFHQAEAENERLKQETAMMQKQIQDAVVELPHIAGTLAHRISMMRQQYDGWCKEYKQENTPLREGLRRLEWSPVGTYVLTNCCPACGGHKDKSDNPEYEKYSPAGHRLDCWLAKLLEDSNAKG